MVSKLKIVYMNLILELQNQILLVLESEVFNWF